MSLFIEMPVDSEEVTESRSRTTLPYGGLQNKTKMPKTRGGLGLPIDPFPGTMATLVLFVSLFEGWWYLALFALAGLVLLGFLQR
jgi:hypothetical protein